MSTELLNLSPEEHALLNQHAQEFGSTGFTEETAVLKVSLEGPNTGKYVLESSERVEEEGKPVTYVKKQVLVSEPTKIVILRKRYSYSYYDSTKKSLELWTNEIDSFDASQPVVVFDKAKDLKNPERMTYAEFKLEKLKRTAWISMERGEMKSLFTFVTVLYVMVDGVFAKFFVKMSSLIGQQADGSYNFKSPLPGSLKSLETEMGNVAPYTKEVFLEAIYVTGNIPYYKHQFRLGGETDIRTMIANRVNLDKALKAIDSYRNKEVLSDDEVPMPEELPTIQIDEPVMLSDSNGKEIKLEDVFGS